METEIKHKGITIRQFLGFVHRYTEWVDICIINNEFTDYPNIPDYLSRDVFHGEDYGKQEEERLLKYYGDAEVWNLHTGLEDVYNNNQIHNGRLFTPTLRANVHFSDIKDAWFREKADIKRQKQKEYRQKKKAERSEQSAE